MSQPLPFIHFAGGVWLHGKDVAVHGDSEIRELRAETCGGKKVPGSREVVITVAEYEALREQWTRGGQVGRGDARLARAALAYLGVNA
jgi:hypothetical protein